MTTFAIIRGVLAGAVILTAAAAWAGSPEETYFAARDAAIQKIKALEDAKQDEAATKVHDAAFADLQAQMRGIIGPVAIKGLPADGTLNLSSLSSGDQGFGTLDGLVYGAPDDKTRAIVTTESIFRTWLRSHKDWWGDKIANVPQDVKGALTSEAFYTQAIQTDAAVMKYAQVPLRAPARASFSFAMLAARSQDDSPPAPGEIFVTLVQAGRVTVANAPVARPFAQIPYCNQLRIDQEKKADAVYAVYEKGEKKDEKLFDRYTAARAAADTLFLRCYAKRATRQPAFAAAVKQAQALLESLPVR
jgi:hypothetical protein